MLVSLLRCLFASLYAQNIVIVTLLVVYVLFAGLSFAIHCQYLNQIYVTLYTQGVLRVRKPVTLMGITVTAIFGICWAPDIVAHNLDLFTSVSISKLAYAVFHTLILFSSAVNPFVYALVNKNFREKLKGMIRCSCSGSTQNRVCPQPLSSETGTSSLE